MSIVQWVKQQSTFNTSGSDITPSIAVDPAGNSYTAYSTNGTVLGQTNTGSNDIVVFKLSPSGTFLWVIQQPTFDTYAGDVHPDIAVDSAGNSYIAYETSGHVQGRTSAGFTDIVVFKLDTSGTWC